MSELENSQLPNSAHSYEVQQINYSENHEFYKYLQDLLTIVTKYRSELLVINKSYEDIVLPSGMRLISLSELLSLEIDNLANRLSFQQLEYDKIREIIKLQSAQSFINPTFEEDNSKDVEQEEERLDLDLQIGLVKAIRKYAINTLKYCDLIQNKFNFLNTKARTIELMDLGDSSTSQYSSTLNGQIQPEYSENSYLPAPTSNSASGNYGSQMMSKLPDVTDEPVI